MWREIKAAVLRIIAARLYAWSRRVLADLEPAPQGQGGRPVGPEPTEDSGRPPAGWLARARPGPPEHWLRTVRDSGVDPGAFSLAVQESLAQEPAEEAGPDSGFPAGGFAGPSPGPSAGPGPEPDPVRPWRIRPLPADRALIPSGRPAVPAGLGPPEASAGPPVKALMAAIQPRESEEGREAAGFSPGPPAGLAGPSRSGAPPDPARVRAGSPRDAGRSEAGVGPSAGEAQGEPPREADSALVGDVPGRGFEGPGAGPGSEAEGWYGQPGPGQRAAPGGLGEPAGRGAPPPGREVRAPTAGSPEASAREPWCPAPSGGDSGEASGGRRHGPQAGAEGGAWSAPGKARDPSYSAEAMAPTEDWGERNWPLLPGDRTPRGGLEDRWPEPGTHSGYPGPEADGRGDHVAEEERQTTWRRILSLEQRGFNGGSWIL